MKIFLLGLLLVIAIPFSLLAIPSKGIVVEIQKTQANLWANPKYIELLRSLPKINFLEDAIIKETRITEEGYLVTITENWATLWDLSSSNQLFKLANKEFWCFEEPYNKISLLFTWSKEKGLKKEPFKRKRR